MTGSRREGSSRRRIPSQPPMDMQQLLALWEGQSAKLKTLELAIYRIDKDRGLGR